MAPPDFGQISKPYLNQGWQIYATTSLLTGTLVFSDLPTALVRNSCHTRRFDFNSFQFFKSSNTYGCIELLFKCFIETCTYFQWLFSQKLTIDKRLAGLSSLGVPGVPWHTQILADQLTLFQPGGTNFAHLFTTGTPGFSDLPTALAQVIIRICRKDFLLIF